MPKSHDTDGKIEQLRAILDQGSENAWRAALQQALKDKSNFLVAKAAKWVSEKLSYELIPDLVASYRRFLRDPLKTDKTCAGKIALVRALYDLDYNHAIFFGEALHYRQQEPIWGGSVDTAVEVRIVAANGLLASGAPRAMIELVDALHDPEPGVRIGVIKAFEQALPQEVELVLRSAIHCGDSEPDVTAQAFSTLMKVAPEASLDFVARYLDASEAVIVEAAAIALGESRLADALTLLMERCDVAPAYGSTKSALYRAIALSRNDTAYTFLLGVIKDENVHEAGEAIKALAIYDYNEELKRAVAARVKAKGSTVLEELYRTHWDGQKGIG